MFKNVEEAAARNILHNKDLPFISILTDPTMGGVRPLS